MLVSSLIIIIRISLSINKDKLIHQLLTKTSILFEGPLFNWQRPGCTHTWVYRVAGVYCSTVQCSYTNSHTRWTQTYIILKTVCVPWTAGAKLTDTSLWIHVTKLFKMSTKDIRPSPSMLTLSPPHHKQLLSSPLVISSLHASIFFTLCVIIFVHNLLGPSSLIVFCLCLPFCWALSCRFCLSTLSGCST